jgi:hypothetical protein
MFKIIDNTGQPNRDDKKSTIGEKISKFFHTKIMGMSPEFYEFSGSLGNRQDDDSSDEIIVYDDKNRAELIQ